MDNIFKVLKQKPANLELYNKKKNPSKMRMELINFQKKIDEQILSQETCATRNVKGSLSNWNKMMPDGNSDLHKRVCK